MEGPCFKDGHRKATPILEERYRVVSEKSEGIRRKFSWDQG